MIAGQMLQIWTWHPYNSAMTGDVAASSDLMCKEIMKQTCGPNLLKEKWAKPRPLHVSGLHSLLI